MIKKIDTHQHFWQFNLEDYGWISDEMKVLRRDFLPADLLAELKANGISQAISIQARQSVEETEWLLELAAKNDFLAGVVGWIPLQSVNIESYLEKYSQHSKFKGVRHVVQGEIDDNFILGSDFNRGIKALLKYDLSYDILIFEKHLTPTIEFVDRHQNQRFVVDHIAKPQIKNHLISPWRENLTKLAKRDNVLCKLSGVITEADLKNWEKSEIKDYIKVVFDIFSPNRLMFGSDYPVLTCAATYQMWVEIVSEFVNQLSHTEQADFWQNNATKFYKL